MGRLLDNQININDSIICEINKTKRYNITLNHTGVHLLNHALRNYYKSEKSIIQINSIVKNESLKFEFSFNQSLKKPDLIDIKSIELICKQLIEKSLNIYTVNNIKNGFDETKLNYPLRKLNDVLYPIDLRIVSIGTDWSNFLSKTNNSNIDYSAELCCGTHASNTSQLKEFLITHLTLNGDSTFEIDACTSESALEAKKNDELVINYLKEMSDLFKMKTKSDTTLSELNFLLHQISDRSIQIENIFKYKKVSFVTLHHVKQESIKYRPSKTMLVNSLKSYLEEELNNNIKLSKNALIISTLDMNSSIKFKFLAFDSVLSHETILSILNRLKDPFPQLIVYNRYRGNYFFYSKTSIDQNKEISDYFNFVQDKLTKDNLNSSVIESKSNYRILKCPIAVQQYGKRQDYFVF